MRSSQRKAINKTNLNDTQSLLKKKKKSAILSNHKKVFKRVLFSGLISEKKFDMTLLLSLSLHIFHNVKPGLQPYRLKQMLSMLLLFRIWSFTA